LTREGRFDSGMDNLKTDQRQYPPLFMQNFETTDMDDLFQNVFWTIVAARGLPFVRQASWRSEATFETAMDPGYLRPDDDILADMRDECDLRLTLDRFGIVIQLLACANYRAVSVAVAGHDLRP
jgi:hypothetical protein